MSKDPIGFAGGLTNLYSYLGGDPINSIDPSGLSDINLWPPSQRIYNSDPFVVTMPGFFSVGGHGNPNAIGTPFRPNVGFSPNQIAQIIKNDPRYTGQPVQLNSCSTGGNTSDGSPNLAQQVANILGVNVVAPTTDIGIYPSGDMLGLWNIFSPSPVPFR